MLELRKLDINEFYDYIDATLYTLEQEGTIKAGTYDRIVGGDDAKSVVNQLRSQLRKIKK